MAITNITFHQSNIYGGSNLLPIHSPLVFILDVEYDTGTPDVLKVGIYDSGNQLLATYKCIPYQDVSATHRHFLFVANSVLKGLMPAFDDQLQTINTLEYIDNITLELTLKFYDPDVPETNIEDTFIFIHGSAQFSEFPNFMDIFNNESKVYYALKDSFVYAYWYNDSESNTVSLGSENPTLDASESVLDFGAEYINGTYQSLDFKLTGYNLTENVILTAPTHFKISLVAGTGSLTSSLNIIPTLGVVNVTIYVAFLPLAVVSYDENLSIEWEGTTIDVQLLGSGDALS
jgi:hypothetical protein